MFHINNPGTGEKAVLRSAVVVFVVDLVGDQDSKILLQNGQIPCVEVDITQSLHDAAASLFFNSVQVTVRREDGSQGWLDMVPVCIEKNVEGENTNLTQVFVVAAPEQLSVHQEGLAWVKVTELFKTGDTKLTDLVAKAIRKI